MKTNHRYEIKVEARNVVGKIGYDVLFFRRPIDSGSAFEETPLTIHIDELDEAAHLLKFFGGVNLENRKLNQ